MINDPVVIKFCNEQLRPLAEKIRDVKLLMEGSVLPAFQILRAEGKLPGVSIDPNTNKLIGSADPIDDGRAAEGVHQLTDSDIAGIIQSTLDLLGVTTPEGLGRIGKACVRAPRITIES